MRELLLLSTEDFKAALPIQMHGKVNQDVMDEVNAALTDPDVREYMQENIIGYAHILNEGKFRIDKYISAVKFASYRMMGNNNKLSYSKTFPDKYKDFLARGVAEKDIASYTTAYAKSKLVVSILTQALTPLHIVNMDKEQAAINKLASLMKDARSENVQRQSAKDLLDVLKRPEAQKIELDLGLKESDGLKALKDITANLAAAQLVALQTGKMTATQVAHQPLTIDQDAADA